MVGQKEMTRVKEREQGRTDISHSRRDANLDTRVSFLCQLTLEEFI